MSQSKINNIIKKCDYLNPQKHQKIKFVYLTRAVNRLRIEPSGTPGFLPNNLFIPQII